MNSGSFFSFFWFLNIPCSQQKSECELLLSLLTHREIKKILIRRVKVSSLIKIIHTPAPGILCFVRPVPFLSGVQLPLPKTARIPNGCTTSLIREPGQSVERKWRPPVSCIICTTTMRRYWMKQKLASAGSIVREIFNRTLAEKFHSRSRPCLKI